MDVCAGFQNCNGTIRVVGDKYVIAGSLQLHLEDRPDPLGPPPQPRVHDVQAGRVQRRVGACKGAASEENVPYVGSAAKCDPMLGGWYYDVDPATAMPTKVVVCDKTCSRFKAEPTGEVLNALLQTESVVVTNATWS